MYFVNCWIPSTSNGPPRAVGDQVIWWLIWNVSSDCNFRIRNEKKRKNPIPFAIATTTTKRIQYLGINLTKGCNKSEQFPQNVSWDLNLLDDFQFKSFVSDIRGKWLSTWVAWGWEPRTSPSGPEPQAAFSDSRILLLLTPVCGSTEGSVCLEQNKHLSNTWALTQIT